MDLTIEMIIFFASRSFLIKESLNENFVGLVLFVTEESKRGIALWKIDQKEVFTKFLLIWQSGDFSLISSRLCSSFLISIFTPA